MNQIIKESLAKSITYQEYRALVKQLAEEKSNTGLEKTEALANYTKLNDRRMKRWDKTIKVAEVAKEKIEAFNRKTTWLIITESWCGDAAHVVPALNKIAELNPNIDVKIVFRDENLELMDMFLTNGGRAIAKLIILDNETGEVLNTYGPRPSEATSYVNRFKAKHGALTPEFKEDLQHWYNKDKGQNIISDVVEILTAVTPIYQ
ncbi:thioredoxin family protein [Algibacter amylolyticus]|uniref:Thioredoxin family protein n=1 Tax=Algibacter amylolyticus TaxID=1608400 RepID=A0A5M7BGD5_9FLAO|nr:thioredoxin family protein [Algibacter amylolyticus]KAA5827880.1 thioredoxin family protein [Algibacter amylolyticus]MBB5267110.1 thiol-disulfide isomerase/thioredoxin [Algibacter amylolyticus]TSJ82125.1 thioredoxin family protein [Algibacter amylolyticus]